MTAPEMTCDEAEALLPLVADGALDAASDPALFSHLGACARCQESLASHDLVTVALASAAAPRPAPRILRPRWQRAVPLAAAAMLAIGVAGWLTARPAEEPARTAVAAAPAPTLVAPPAAVPAKPVAAPAPVVAIAEPPPRIDVEVLAMPGSTPAHPRYLVRKGEQILLVDPAASAPEAPADAKPASYSRRLRY